MAFAGAMYDIRSRLNIIYIYIYFWRTDFCFIFMGLLLGFLLKKKRKQKQKLFGSMSRLVFAFHTYIHRAFLTPSSLFIPQIWQSFAKNCSSRPRVLFLMASCILCASPFFPPFRFICRQECVFEQWHFIMMNMNNGGLLTSE